MEPTVFVELLAARPLDAAVPSCAPLRPVDLAIKAADEESKRFVGRFWMHRTVRAGSVDRDDFSGRFVGVELFSSKSESCEDVCGVSPEKVSPRVAYTRIRLTVQLRLIQKLDMAG
ncbi:MAG: hypothetical protein HOQ32_01090 [Lysobacter sp.]|nr:hypothetical protein [Lysobacter sp.]